MNRIFGIAGVWIGCAVAWVVLGSTLLVRSDVATSAGSQDVYSLWGPPAEQAQPTAHYTATRTVSDSRSVVDPTTGLSREVRTDREESHDVPIPLTGSDVAVALSLEHRRRGLSWYPTYTVDLDGRFRFRNDSGAEQRVTFEYPLSEQHAVFDGFDVREGERSVEMEITDGRARWSDVLAAGETREYRVGYRSRGTERWHYRMAAGTSRSTDFRLDVTTDFAEVDFPEGTLSPTTHSREGGGWHGTWEFDSIIASQPIGIELPRRLDPGPLAARITFFAPVGLLFFFFVVGILASARARELHPMHYFFLGCAFFAFHLLFAYLVDHLPIAGSFAISAVVSVLLVVSYARHFVGWRFALTNIGIAQLLYLVLFSYTFMWEGFTGLAITAGAILTLLVMMQITGKRAWGAKRAAPSTKSPPEEPATLDARPSTF